MPYQHGIYVSENPTSLSKPVLSAAVQVIIGTAPVNLVKDPSKAVNVPLLANSYDEAVAAVGYSDDWDKYTLCQSIDASFKKFGVGPLVLINVLDPAVHKKAMDEQTVNIINGIAAVKVFGVLLDNTFIVKDSAGAVTYVKDTDYTVAFDADGYPEITALADGNIPNDAQQFKVTGNVLDPSAVTTADIIGGYTSATNTYKGIECISQVYPIYNLVPGLLLAPGWSQNKEVAAALDTKSTLINGSFNATEVVDLDCNTVKVYSAVAAWKTANGYIGKRQIALWPKVSIDGKAYWYSAIIAALTAYIDAQNNGVPYKSPSNKLLPIDAAVLEDGTEVYLDQLQANVLNANGVVTAVNIAGWRSWGNNTAIYPDSIDPKDRFIPIRRTFDWWGNTFIVNFFSKVDDPTNYRLIESIVDEENIRGNGLQAAGQIAGAKIEFSEEDNLIADIASGRIQFIQKIGAFPPAENIVNVLEFDPSMLQAALFGGE